MPDRSLRQVLEEATARLAPTSPSPRLDAEVLAMHVCRLTRAALITRATEPLDADQARRLEALLARRARGEPVAYLTGEREFWSLTLKVTPDTLIPRPETETLVERALAHIPADARWTLADIGTGSGAVAFALARERPGCWVLATDSSAAALAVARENARRLGIGNVEFRQGDWLAPLGADAVALVASNPPYVPTGDPHLLAGDLRFEPLSALAAGPNGLDAIRRIAFQARARLPAGGWLLLEHGHDQGGAVRELLRAYGYRDIRCLPDLAGRDRVTEGRRG